MRGDTCVESYSIIMGILINGYDSPEIRPYRSLEKWLEINAKAVESKNYLKSLVANSLEQLWETIRGIAC